MIRVDKSTAPILELRGVGKSYGAVRAVDSIDLALFRGDVLAICGDNGAGKSSLIKVISGAELATDGNIILRGERTRFASPQEALRGGIATIYQDLALAPRLSIYENIFMGAELTRSVFPWMRILNRSLMQSKAAEFLKRLSVPITDTRALVESLSGGQRQAVAICRALLWDAEIIIMDEPTAALGVKETFQVNRLIQSLREEGRTVILISHNMTDVVALATRVLVLSRGRKIIDRKIAGLKPEDISSMIMTDGVSHSSTSA